MTAPNQALTPGISEWLGVGAYEIGGADSNYGQAVDESFVNALVKIPLPNLANMFEVLEDLLLKLPIEILEAFKPFIPDWLEDDILDAAQAVVKILDSLSDRDIPAFLHNILDLLGIDDLTQGNNFFTNLLEFLNNPVLTGDPALFDPIAAAGDFINNVLKPTGEFVAEIADWILDLLGGAGSTAIPTASLPQVVESWQNMWAEWFGGPSTGTPTEVAQVFESIRATVAGGYTLQTFTSSNAAWSVPSDLAASAEAYAIAIGGGGKGMPGQGASTAAGGVGGSNGGYLLNKVDAGAFASTLAITIGAAAVTNGANGGQTFIQNGGVDLVRSQVGLGAISTTQGYVPSVSLPGSGGTGGRSAAQTGSPGGSNPYAAGGAGGAPGGGGNGGPGGTGGTGSITDTPITGGGGGGGGGGRSGVGLASGGAGGTGGFPGAGGGGGGSSSGDITGTGGGAAGTPGAGWAALLWR